MPFPLLTASFKICHSSCLLLTHTQYWKVNDSLVGTWLGSELQLFTCNLLFLLICQFNPPPPPFCFLMFFFFVQHIEMSIVNSSPWCKQGVKRQVLTLRSGSFALIMSGSRIRNTLRLNCIINPRIILSFCCCAL